MRTLRIVSGTADLAVVLHASTRKRVASAPATASPEADMKRLGIGLGILLISATPLLAQERHEQHEQHEQQQRERSWRAHGYVPQAGPRGHEVERGYRDRDGHPRAPHVEV